MELACVSSSFLYFREEHCLCPTVCNVDFQWCCRVCSLWGSCLVTSREVALLIPTQPGCQRLQDVLVGSEEELFFLNPALGQNVF